MSFILDLTHTGRHQNREPVPIRLKKYINLLGDLWQMTAILDFSSGMQGLKF